MSVARMFTEQVVIEPFTGDGARGALYGPPVTEPARVQEGDAYKRGRDGNADRHEVDPVTVVYLRYAAACPERSQITLPGGQKGVAVKVTRHRGRPAIRHLKVVLG